MLRLLALGAAAVTLHAVARGRLHLGPGHQGLIWIALLMVGRVTSSVRWAGSVSAAGAGATSMLPLWGFGDPFRWLAYLVTGATLDAAGRWSRGWGRRLWLVTVLGGLAHATKPLVRAAVSLGSGWPYESLLGGLAYPVWTHFLFGAAGALIGAGVVRISRLRSAGARLQA